MSGPPGVRLLLPVLLLGCAAGGVRIVDRPVSWSSAREAATAAYMQEHYGLEGSAIEPRIIVVHWTAMASADAAWRTFDRESLGSGRGDIASGGSVNVSAHFLVDRDGTVYRLLPEKRMARHVIGLNHCAIGIENAGGVGGRDDLTDAQLDADARLVRDLKRRYPGIAYLIGHHEYRAFEGTALWKEKDPGYRTVKTDPGDAFMRRLRERVRDLGLKGVPVRQSS